MLHCGICHSLFEQDKVKVPVRIDWYVGSGDDEKHVLRHVGMTAKCVVHQILDSWCEWFHEEAPKVPALEPEFENKQRANAS